MMWLHSLLALLPFARCAPMSSTTSSTVLGHFTCSSVILESPESLTKPLKINLGFDLNPEWSPDADNLAPISEEGMNPWDDSGRSQMMDNIDTEVCPAQILNCKKCPKDFRCKPPFFLGFSASSSSNSTTSAQPTHKSKLQRLRPRPQYVEQGEFNALAGPQLAGFDPKANHTCPIKKCSNAEGDQCGRGAKCTKGYCVCLEGKKSLQRNIARGMTSVAEFKIFLDSGLSCNVSCLSIFCSEVEMIQECDFADPNSTQSSEQSVAAGNVLGHFYSESHSTSSTEASGQQDSEALGLDTGGHGGVRFPGASVIERNDYDAGSTSATSVGAIV